MVGIVLFNYIRIYIIKNNNNQVVNFIWIKIFRWSKFVCILISL